MPTSKTTKRSATRGEDQGTFSEEEIAAMKERARELKAAKRKGTNSKADGESEMRAKIEQMAPEDRATAERIHAAVMSAAPNLEPSTWYGMPAWKRDGQVLCFFTPASKFKERYSSFGFNASANLDDGNMWPTAWAVERVTDAEAARIAELVKKAVG